MLFINPFEGDRDFYLRYWSFSELFAMFFPMLESMSPSLATHTIQKMFPGLILHEAFSLNQSDFNFWPQMVSVHWYGMCWAVTVARIRAVLWSNHTRNSCAPPLSSNMLSYWRSPKLSVAHCPADVELHALISTTAAAAAVNRHPIATVGSYWNRKQSCRRLDCPSFLL